MAQTHSFFAAFHESCEGLEHLELNEKDKVKAFLKEKNPSKIFMSTSFFDALKEAKGDEQLAKEMDIGMCSR